MTAPEKPGAPTPPTLRIVCTDFDGTIAEGDGSPICTDFFERLVGWRKQGKVYWIINTGRTFESLREELVRRKTPIWPDWAVGHRTGNLVGAREAGSGLVRMEPEVRAVA